MSVGRMTFLQMRHRATRQARASEATAMSPSRARWALPRATWLTARQIAAAAALSVTAFFGVGFVLDGCDDTRSELLRRVAEAARRDTAATQAARRLPRLRAQYGPACASRAGPLDDAHLFDATAAAAHDTGVTLVSAQLDEAAAPDPRRERILHVRATGAYRPVVSFLSRATSLPQGVTLGDLALHAREGGAVEVHASLRFTAVARPSSPPALPPAAWIDRFAAPDAPAPSVATGRANASAARGIKLVGMLQRGSEQAALLESAAGSTLVADGARLGDGTAVRIDGTRVMLEDAAGARRALAVERGE